MQRLTRDDLVFNPFSPTHSCLNWRGVPFFIVPIFLPPFSSTGAVNLTRTPMSWLSGVVFLICFLRFVVSILILLYPSAVYQFFLVYQFTLHHMWSCGGSLILCPFLGSLLLSCLRLPCLLSWTGLFDLFCCCFPAPYLAPEALTACCVDRSRRERALHSAPSFCKLAKLQIPFLAVDRVCHAPFFLTLFFCVRSRRPGLVDRVWDDPSHLLYLKMDSVNCSTSPYLILRRCSSTSTTRNQSHRASCMQKVPETF